MHRRFLRLANPSERLAQLKVDRLELGRAGPLLPGQRECPPERDHGLVGPLQGELAAPEVVDEQAARLAAGRRLEQGQRFLRAHRVEQGETQLIARQGVLRGELQLLAELGLRATEPVRTRLRVRQGHHAQVVVRSPHAGILLERRAQLHACALVLAGVAVRAADQDVRLWDRPGLDDLGEQSGGGVRPLEPEVFARQQEHDLRVVGPRRHRLVQPLRRPIGLPGGQERSREKPPGLHVARVLSGERRQDLHGRRGLAHLEVPPGQGSQPLPAPAREGVRLAVRVARLRQAFFDPLQRPHQEPALEQGLAVVALGGRELALLQARLRHGDRPLEGKSGILSHLGGSRGGEQATEHEGGGSAAKARHITFSRHDQDHSISAPAGGAARDRAAQGAMVKETLSSALLEPWVTPTSNR